jgi:hypothetical protein
MVGSNHTSRAILALAGLLLVVGIGLRLVPIIGSDERVLQAFPTEDGYLMLTMARNIAIGHGMSVSDGAMLTNGTQPLTTFEWALCFFLSDGDKALGVRFSLYAQFVLSLLTVVLMYRLGCRMLRSDDHGRTIAALAAATWFASPLGVGHSMNCLETGNYVFLTLAVFMAFLSSGRVESREWSWWRVIATGVLLGVTFWTRNDAVFLILAACLVYMTRAGRITMAEMRARIPRTLVMGLMSIVIALPWMLHNHSNFGSIMPISGHAQAYWATFGGNLKLVSSTIFEYVSIIVQIPNAIQGQLLVEVGCFLLLALLAVVLWRRYQLSGDEERSAIFLIAVFMICLVSFYGLYFGAPHFIARYFYPLSPVLAILSMYGVFRLWRFLSRQRVVMAKLLAYGASIVAVGLIVGLNARRYQRTARHMHFQSVDWIAENVAAETWIGAPQTGSIGFFHDRTINLDGKVNRDAFRHAVAGTIPQYVVDSEIDYIVDWFLVGERWKSVAPLDTEFEVLVSDEELNLSVLARKDRAK